MASRKRANESSVWEHMEKKENGKAECRLCKRLFAAVGGSTSGLKGHLQTMHPDVVAKSQQTQPTLPSFGVNPQRKCNNERQEKITVLLTKVIVANMLPLSLVDNAEFREMMEFIEPNFKMPCRQTMTNRIDSTKVEVEKRVRTELDAVPAVSLTSDIWTSLSNDAYMSVTSAYITDTWTLKTRTLANIPMEERHTQCNIAARLKECAQSYGIQDKVHTIVHDGASNMRETGMLNNWTDVSCAAHKLHLIVTGALGMDKGSKSHSSNASISKCVAAASRLVGHFSHSALACVELDKQQKTMAITGENGKPLKLQQYVKTRWNSVFVMFERLVKLRWPVTAVLSDKNITKSSDAATLDMKEEYWRLMTDLLPVLRPLQVVSELLSAEKTPTASLVYPLLWKLVSVELEEKPDDSSAVKSIKGDVVNGIKERFNLTALEAAKNPFVVATVLDPATKTMELFPSCIKQAAYDKVRCLVDDAVTGSTSVDSVESDNNTAAAVSPPAKKAKLDPRAASLKFLANSSAPPQRISEFDQYLALPVDNSVDVLQYWHDNEAIYPNVASVARKYLCAPATSTSSDRQFSACGRLVTKLRSSLDADRVESLIFLHENM